MATVAKNGSGTTVDSAAMETPKVGSKLCWAGTLGRTFCDWQAFSSLKTGMTKYATRLT